MQDFQTSSGKEKKYKKLDQSNKRNKRRKTKEVEKKQEGRKKSTYITNHNKCK